MFGYVVINKPEIKFKDFDLYRSYYCGLCRDLKEDFGFKGQMTLNYDLTFLAILLDGLYEDNTVISECRCIVHPFSKHATRRNEYTDYAADMNILLTYYQCLDDYKDDKNRKKKRFAKALKSRAEKVMEKYPEKSKRIEEELKKLSELENKGEENIDLTSGCFGRIMSELFLYKIDEWTEYLDKMGFFLGKYIYILDAFCDYDKDMEKGRFNALKGIGKDQDKIKNMLTLMMSECTKNYEMLPIVENNDILQNILYSGVWTGFEIGSVPKRDREQV
ncbi:MAG: hypothetical protein IK007_02065 [Lachnospiraceae bacterium]|nr:hypothetical protein [Lachnospiraceae bacterium]MBR4776380.1 hypothetical protein [Lachnospiraceae bacterium]MBR6474988.1 hypothetical protein [Lachnospiraceae bacterium]